MSNFRIGQKVVCVDDGPSRLGDVDIEVKRGCIYTIRGFDRFKRSGTYALYLEGIHARARRSGRGDGEELAWDPARFRPLIERKTDISIFTEMLNTKETPVKAGA